MYFYNLLGNEFAVFFNVFFVFNFQDCRYFKSKKTGRGPLKEGWRVSKFLYNYHLIGKGLNRRTPPHPPPPTSSPIHITFLSSPRVVSKISSCQLNTTTRRGIRQIGISFGSIFFLFSYESSQGPHS